MISIYYNEIDPYAAQWLRNLIAAGHIAAGDVDERSIVDVHADDLRGYRQCHFFAGIGGWSFALKLAGWPDDRPIWTGSCPCQPLSAAGQRKGHVDERHLWPAFHRLIAVRAPATVFGEQVAGKDGREWFAAVRTDMEALGYACGAADLCAAGFGAPHIRQRLYWVADAGSERGVGEYATKSGGHRTQDGIPCGDGGIGWLGDASRIGAGPATGDRPRAQEAPDGGNRSASRTRASVGDASASGELGDPDCGGSSPGRQAAASLGHRGAAVADGRGDAASPTNGHWRAADWLLCRDGKWRPVEPGAFPLAHGIPARVGRLRAYGNAIVPQVGAEFIMSYVGMQERRCPSPRIQA